MAKQAGTQINVAQYTSRVSGAAIPWPYSPNRAVDNTSRRERDQDQLRHLEPIRAQTPPANEPTAPC